MGKTTNDSNNQTYNYMYVTHQLTIYNSHDPKDDIRSGCQNFSQCQQHFFLTTLTWTITLERLRTPGFKPF